MKLYVILRGDSILRIEKGDYSPMPLTENELENMRGKINAELGEVIDILDDLGIDEERDDIDDYDVQQSVLMRWINEFMDNNINGFDLPIWIECNKDYLAKLQEVFNKYMNAIDTPAFRHEKGLISDVRFICDKLLACYKEYHGSHDQAKEIMKHILRRCIDNKFLISELGKSYALRGIAPFYELHHAGYDNVYEVALNTPLDLYRIRSVKENVDLTSPKDMFHIPYSERYLAVEQRFSPKETPCLYLGTSSYDCWIECREPGLETVYVSGFRPVDKGEKLKILNLAVSEGLINGMYTKKSDDYLSPEHFLQNEIMRIFPLVIATSFSVKEKEENRERVEYIIPHLIMQVLREFDIDGVAYLSKRVESCIQYPCAINIALPAYDISEEKEYGEICGCFKVTPPKKFATLIENETISKNYISIVYDNEYTDPSLKQYKDKCDKFVRCDNNIIDLYEF